MQESNYTFKEIPIEHLQEDPHQPRKDFGTQGDQNRLVVSIKEIGIKQPLTVSAVSAGKYNIIDGHRRYRCAQKLGLKTVPCWIYPKLPASEFERTRFELQNNHRNWKPLERAESLNRIKDATGFTNDQIAKFLHTSKTAVSTVLSLRKEKEACRALMEQYELPDTYQIEFVRLRPKIRKIRDLDIEKIYRIIFEKAQHKVVGSAKEFRKLGRAFLRASANEEALHKFLKDADMTIDELMERTVQNDASLWSENIGRYIANKLSNGIAFTMQEKQQLLQLRDLLNRVA